MAEHPVLGERILRRHPRARPARADRAPRARALGRQRLPGRPRRHADPDRLADHPRLRRVRRDDDGAALPRGARAARRPWPSCARAAGSQFDPQVVEALLDLLGPATRAQVAAAFGGGRRRDQRRAVGEPGRPVVALVLRAGRDVGLRALRLRVVAGVLVAAGPPDVVVARAEASAGAQVGTVSATTLPFLTGSDVASGNWTVWPKYGVSVCSGLRAETRP